ncbi:MAG: hypothetical protein ABSE20_14120 [Acetobacteraceae bacterium]|jgi:hypothetical protein
MFGPASVLGTQGVADFTCEAIVQVMTFASLSARPPSEEYEQRLIETQDIFIVQPANAHTDLGFGDRSERKAGERTSGTQI